MSAMAYSIALVHKTAEPVIIQLARVPVRGDFIEFMGGPWEVKRVLLLPADLNACAATVWGAPADFPLPEPIRRSSEG